MTGQEIVDLVETLTGRTNEPTKMLTRINAIQRMLWSEHDWEFAIDHATVPTDPVGDSTNFATQGDGGIVHTFWATTANDVTNKGNGNWIYSVTDDQYIRLSQNSSTLVAYPDGVVETPNFTGKWFRIDYGLERFALDENTVATSTKENFSRLIGAWVDGAESELEIVSLAEWDRRVPQLDINNTGTPEFAALTQGWIQTFGVGGGSAQYKKGPVLRVWPIPDARYEIHYNYYANPVDITLASTPLPSDDKWHQALAFGAAYLTRLDDVDATWQEFKRMYDEAVNQMTWTYKVTPNFSQGLPGPRQNERAVAGSKIRPFN